ncbi:nitroreductase family protein [Maridesulfovibrio sp.]|uniref:nitroreductase family protein n=1 Tax=Maridesulfovibrio sp. TaxID=2795000 RepID=UPI0029F58F85|nr:nitroreductase family protein [Maridesulfovibrio sp.]
MEFKEILENRRAVNFFDPEKDVTEAQLKEIVEDAAKSPSSFNLQPWKMIILRDSEQKGKLQKLAFDQPKVSEAPVVIILLADREGWKEGNTILESHFKNNLKPDQREWFISTTAALYGSSEAATQAFANKNAGLFAMSLMYSASNLGLHTHPMDGFDHEAVRKEFNIPDQYWIPMLICVGQKKADVEILPKAWRQSFEEIVLETK